MSQRTLERTRPATAATGNGADTTNQSEPRKHNRPTTKIQRVFRALADGRSFNMYEAERELHDHTLRSTVSEIQSRYGIRVDRKYETIPAYQGIPTPVKRYWLSPPERQKARMQIASDLVASGAYKTAEAALRSLEGAYGA